MVRPRPVVSRLALIGFSALTTLALAADRPAAPGPKAEAKGASRTPADSKSAAAPPASGGKTAKRAAEPLDHRPYRIRAWVSVDPAARIDSIGRARLVDEWRRLVRRFVGAPWELEVAEGDGPLETDTIDSLDRKTLVRLAAKVDKAWMIRIEPDSAGHRLTGREFDVLTSRLGPIFNRQAPFPADAPRALFTLALDLFEPTAEVGAKTGGGVFITVKGAAIPPASPEGQVVKPGKVFRPIRLWLKPDGSVLRIDDIRRSFLRISAIEGRQARCDIVTSLADPLTSRTASRNTLVALGVKPSNSPMLLHYLTAPDKVPAAGYILTARTYPDGTPVEVGMTDRDGRLTLPSGFADGLVVFRLLAADIEPMDEFPAMPGLSLSERPVIIDPKPQTVALETELNSMRDELIDQVAIRARIESRLKARVEGEKWEEAEQLLSEYRKLPRRPEFVERLEKLRSDAARRQAETKKAVLTRKALNMISDTQALIDRYMDDEIFKAYADGISQVRGEAKKGAAKKGFPAVARSPASGAGPATAAAGAGTGGFSNTPDGALRTFLLAMALADEATLRDITLPSDGFDWLLRGARSPASQAASLRKSIEDMKMKRLSAGEQVTMDGEQTTVRPEEDTADSALVLQEGAPSPTRCRRVGGRWRVDAAQIITARRAADAARAAAGAPPTPAEAPPKPAAPRRPAPADGKNVVPF
jgi:hypothetical protein